MPDPTVKYETLPNGAPLRDLTQLPDSRPASHPYLGEQWVHWVASTEMCDPHAIWFTWLTAAAAAIGPRPHLQLGAWRVPCILNTLIVGDSTFGAKGASWKSVRRLATWADPTLKERIEGGWRSAEKLIGWLSNTTNPPDPRLLYFTDEFGRLVQMMLSHKSSMHHLLLQAWDGGRLSSRSYANDKVAEQSHICLLAHTTPTVVAQLDALGEQGFHNRMLYVYSHRPAPQTAYYPPLVPEDLPDFVRYLEVIRRAAVRGETPLTPAAHAWISERLVAIEEATVNLPNPYLLARLRDHHFRLALLLALLSEAPAVDVTHLEEAHALWCYHRDTVLWLWGEALEDAVDRRPDWKKGEHALHNRIIGYVEAHPGCSYADIAASLERRLQRRGGAELREALAQLIRVGATGVSGKGVRGSPRRYWPPDTAPDYAE